MYRPKIADRARSASLSHGRIKVRARRGNLGSGTGVRYRALTTDAELRVRRPPSRSTASHNGGCPVYSNGKPSCRRLGRQARHEWSAIEAVKASCWGGETSSRFLPLARIGFAPLRSNSRNAGALRSGAVRNARTALTSEGSTGIGRLRAPTTEYTGEPLWLTGTVSKIC
jgi:hypothetical protein